MYNGCIRTARARYFRRVSARRVDGAKHQPERHVPSLAHTNSPKAAYGSEDPVRVPPSALFPAPLTCPDIPHRVASEVTSAGSAGRVSAFLHAPGPSLTGADAQVTLTLSRREHVDRRSRTRPRRTHRRIWPQAVRRLPVQASVNIYRPSTFPWISGP